ncbi:hypothetical protein ISN45_Aa01g023410 [Arabidopsis thaliana x Arabidopsis arenosa]|uniref:Uncharacterized protein n=1 Tax=Arabidopsis thaliana x Arabidopsis arenosa TaxID=1240361 RepID=A0A8T2C0H5_9BRAS|nr:hypothetical protein ISN45_Aa01g023410 [Arabidopsis thaliana x Arabidopsis arenosa]
MQKELDEYEKEMSLGGELQKRSQTANDKEKNQTAEDMEKAMKCGHQPKFLEGEKEQTNGILRLVHLNCSTYDVV